MIFEHSYRDIGLIVGICLVSQLATATDAVEVPVCNRVEFSGCLNGVTSSVTNGASLRVNSGAMSDVARERSGAEGSNKHAGLLTSSAGLAAGDDLGGVSDFGMWASYSYNNFDSDFAFQGTSLAYDADSHSALFGIDRLYADSFMLGLAFGYQAGDSSSGFNGGRQDNDAFTLAPYAAVLINDIISVDVTGGVSWAEYDQVRISSADGSDIGVGFDADRWFISSNVNALWVINNWALGARVGYLHTNEEQDGYVEAGSAASAAGGLLRTVRKRQIDLSQMSASVDVGYNFGGWEPYVMATYRNDLSRDDGERAGGLPGRFVVVQPDDDDEVQLNFGVRVFTSWGASMTAEYQRVEGRKFFDSDTFMLTLRAGL